MKLVFPAIDMKEAALAYIQEYFDHGEEVIHGAPGLAAATSYENWLSQIKHDLTRDDGRIVPATAYFAIMDNEIVGTLHIRHKLNDGLMVTGGHIGYGVRPTARRKGYATQMLACALDKCREMGIDRALVTCDKNNIGSARTITSNGGELWDEIIEDNGDILQRYWIAI